MDYKNEFQSDDDFDCSNGYSDSYNNNAHGQSRHSNPNGLSKAELRKTNKPIMEKRRRARINHCLNELKSLILEAMKKDPARHTKLEKADILEMTVKHLQSVQRQQLNMAIQTDPTVIHKFKTGFTECAEEVNRYIGQLEGVDTVVRQRLTNHLNNCATSLEQIGSMTNFNNGYRGQLGGTGSGGLFGAALTANALAMPAAGGAVRTNGSLFPPLPQDLNNNSNSSSGGNPVAPIQMGGVQLIPSRLPSGEFALIVPNPPVVATNLLNHNNSNNGALPFASWPHALSATAMATPAAATTTPLAATGTPINDFAANFKRLSAFTKPPTQAAPKQTSIASNNNNNSNHSASYIIAPTSHNYTHQQQQQRAAAGHNSAAASTTATNSPPLSPISSISSHGDDSLMHTSSDFTASRPATPPHDAASQQHSFSGVFSTPPSAESSLSVSIASSRSGSASSGSGSASTGSTPASLGSGSALASSTANGSLSAHLQQQQVSSTSGNGSANNNNNTSTNTSQHNNSATSSGNDSTASLKRPLAEEEADSSDASAAEPAAKKAATSELPSARSESPADKLQMATKLKECCAADERDSMWRPW